MGCGSGALLIKCQRAHKQRPESIHLLESVRIYQKMRSKVGIQFRPIIKRDGDNRLIQTGCKVDCASLSSIYEFACKQTQNFMGFPTTSKG